jgi:hypothetical protein
MIVAMTAQTVWPQDNQTAAPATRIDPQWRRVQALNRGEEVKIKRLDNKTVGGFVVTVTDDEFTANTESGAVTIARPDIKEVKVRSMDQQRKNGFIGAAIGGASGVTTAVILDGALTDGNGVSEGAVLFFGAIGAAAGLLIRMLRPAYRTIYKAPR